MIKVINLNNEPMKKPQVKMNPDKIPYSANRKVCWENGYKTAIEEVEKIIIKIGLSEYKTMKFKQQLQELKENVK